MPKFSKRQTGTRNTKGVARKSKRLGGAKMPWGFAVPLRKTRGVNSVSGSAVKKSRPDPSLAPQTQGYPRNKPYAWPVEPDLVGHTLPPPLSGYTSAVAAANNAAVNHAYQRAGY